MKICYYDEVDHYDVHRLTMLAFGWAMRPREIRYLMRHDPRVMDGYGLYAVEDGLVVAQVVPLHMPVRLTSGVEVVGGMAGVCSLPSIWGRGYARALLERAHELYREEGYDISTLMTSRNIRGYGIYRRLRYVDLAPFRHATHRVKGRRAGAKGLRLRRAKKGDLPTIQSLFELQVEGQYGWTERNPRVLRNLVRLYPKTLEAYHLVLRDGKAVGYVRAPRGEAYVADEAIVSRLGDLSEALRSLEGRSKREYGTVANVICQRDTSRLAGLGYAIDGPAMATVMATPLNRRHRAAELPRVFGADEGRLVLYPTDWF